MIQHADNFNQTPLSRKKFDYNQQVQQTNLKLSQRTFEINCDSYDVIDSDVP